jgi:hypothetical protein
VPLTLADVRVWYPWGTPFVEVTDQSDGYPVATRIDTSNAQLSDNLRKVTLEFETVVSGARTDDLILCGFHVLDAEGAGWNAAAFEDAEARFDTFWSALATRVPSLYRLAGITWHRAGPRYDPPSTAGAAVRRVTRSVAGSASGTLMVLPRQVATTLTERTMLRKRWGRVYLPPPAAGHISAGAGGYSPDWCTTVADAAEALYGGMASDDRPIVVYSRAQPSRGTKRGGTLPAKPAAALKVNTLQVDNVPDVMRSRRLKQPTIRVRRGLTV